MDEVIALRGVSKRMPSGEGWATILSDIDLSFRRGEYCAIVGNSGSGKSTLLYLLGALDVPSAGSIHIDGINISGLPEGELARLRNEKLGFVFQFHYVLPEFTALENVMLPMQVAGRWSAKQQKERAQQLLDTLDMGDRLQYLPSQLSGGQLQRVAIARALANEPLVILADEPTGNLDSRNSQTVFDTFRKLNRELGQTFLIVTHTTKYVETCDRIITLADGRVVGDTVSGACAAPGTVELRP